MIQNPDRGLVAGLMIVLGWCSGIGFAAEVPPGEPGLVQRVEDQAKQVGKSMEETFKDTAKKVEEERIPEKVEKKVKEIVDDVVDGFEKTGKNIEKKFSR